MDRRNSALPKSKPPPPKESDGESDEESETSDVNTEDEEQVEGGSEYESESDKSIDSTKKKLTSILPTKQQPTAPQSDRKKESAAKLKPSTATKEKPLKDSTAEKDPKKSTKKKPQSSASKSEASKPSKSNTSEEETLQKAVILSRPWLPDEELALSKEIQKDRVNDIYGVNLLVARADPYWEKLISRHKFMDKYEEEYRVERL